MMNFRKSRIPYTVLFWVLIVLAIGFFIQWTDPKVNLVRSPIWLGIMLVYAVVTLFHLFIQMFFAHLEYRRQEKVRRRNQDQVEKWHEEGWRLDQKYMYQPSVTIIIPAYNEKTGILKKCINSCASQVVPGGLEVILVDDGSSNQEELKVGVYDYFSADPNVTVLYQENRGKRFAQKSGFDHANHEIIVTVDSDTVFHDENAVMELVQPLLDQKIGAVTGDVRVENKEDNFLSKLIYYRYWNAFNQERAAQSYFSVVMCCSGPLSAYRRTIIDQVKERYIDQHFLGDVCTYGDDRHLTNLVLAEGYGTQYNSFAECFTEVPTQLSKYTVQQTRWNRSFYREMLWTAPYLFKKNIYLAYDLLMQLILPFWLLFAVFTMIYEVWFTGDLLKLVSYLLIILVISLVRCSYGLLRSRDFGFLSFLPYGLLHILVLIPIRLYALFTLKTRKWGTR